MDLKYVITGTGRCGTKYMAAFLNACGIPCGHETIFTPLGIVDLKSTVKYLDRYNLNTIKGYVPDIIADSSLYAAPFTYGLDCKIIHVVRNPLMVIRSMLNKNYNKSDVETIKLYKELLPKLVGCNKIDINGAAYYWVTWNKLIKSNYLHRIEDSEEGLCEYLGVKKPIFSYSEVTSGGSYLSLSDITDKVIRDEVYDLAVSYGYKFNDKLHI